MAKEEPINKEVILCKNDKERINELIIRYKPFIFDTLYSLEKEFNINPDDFLTVGMLAFKEAIEKYAPDKGSFLSFAKLVIRSRTIDYIRKTLKKQKNEELILSDDDYKKVSYINEKTSLDYYDIKSQNEYRKLEIMELKKILSNWEMTMDEMVENSPRKKSLRKLYINIAKEVSENNDLLKNLFETKRLPIKQICEMFKVNRKKIERGRKYIIFLILIMSGDYPYVKSYLEMGCEKWRE